MARQHKGDGEKSISERAWAVGRFGRALAIAALLPVAMAEVAGRGVWWPQAAVTIALYTAVTAPGAAWMLDHNPSLFRERARGLSNAGTAPFDRVFVPAAGGLYLCIYLAAALQHRLQGAAAAAWSTLAVQIWGALLIAAGGALLTWSMVVNRFFSSVVRIQSDRPDGPHTVCSAGPYSWVRHPGYTGFIMLSAGHPLLLGSSWAAASAATFCVTLVIRTILEERFLSARLPGYASYAERVRWRLVPGVW